MGERIADAWQIHPYSNAAARVPMGMPPYGPVIMRQTPRRGSAVVVLMVIVIIIVILIVIMPPVA